MIRILCSRSEAIASDIEYHKRVTDITEYPLLYSGIMNALECGEDLTILVHNSYIAEWLKVLSSRYSRKQVEYSIITVHSLLEERLRIKVPETVTEEEIIGSGLLDLRIPANETDTFEDYLLRTFFAEFLTKSNFLLFASDIQQNYNKEQWDEALSRPLVKNIYLNKINTVRQQINSSNNFTEARSFSKLLEWFEISPENYLENVAYLRILHTYPQPVGNEIFGNIFSELIDIGLDIRKVETPHPIAPRVLNEITLFLAKPIQSEEQLNKVIDHLSGLLLFEVERVIEIISKVEFPVSSSVIKNIQMKFRGISQNSNVVFLLDSLQQYMAVPIPENPNPNWDEYQMLNWATKQYLPYRYQLENQGKLNSEVVEMVTIFSEWLYARYPSLIYNSPLMAWKSFLGLREEISQYDGTVFVLMVDNLNFKLYPILRELLNKKGFYQQSLHECFSMLPSYTDVSKRSIIAGNYAPFQGSNYSKTVEDIWSNRYNKRIKYVPNVNELRNIRQNDWDVYFLNYIPLDTLLHQNENQVGITHDKLARIYLDSLVNDIYAFLTRINVAHLSKIIVLSDHGSTKIPKNSGNVLQNSFIKKHATDEHHRFITISDEELILINTSDEKFLYYLFPAEKFHLPENFLVAKKFYHFLPTNDSSYIHGGLTPEETIIPVAVFESKQLLPKPLKLRIVKPDVFIAGTRQTMSLEVTNLNNFSLEKVRLSFVDANLTVDPIEVVEISQFQRDLFSSKFVCPVDAEVSKETISVYIEYEVNHLPYEDEISIPAYYRSMMETKFDFDNL